MTSIFSKIIAREIPGHFIYEDDVCIAILDRFPVVPGQTVVIPKKEVAYIFDLDDATYEHLFRITKKVGLAIDAVFNPLRTCIVVEGLEVPHVHVKLFPITERQLKTSGGIEAEDAILSEHAQKITEAMR